MRLRFHLAGINNQNFLMRDEETGTYWQQISGAAISGPLAGRRLELIPFDELTFATWKAEQPQGTVLQDVPAFASQYAPKNWDVRMARAPVVLSFPEQGRKQRDLLLGIRAFGASRAYLYEDILAEKLVLDRLGSEPVMLVLAADGESVRAFRRKIPGQSATPEFYRQADPKAPLLIDDLTGSGWNFQGCAVTGKSTGVCLDRVEAIKDYWFDWRNYNPGTTVYRPGDRKVTNQ